jgi:hypothetical protein
MARRSPDEAIVTAVIARLGSQTTSANYTDVPQGTVAPYRVVTLPAARRVDTCGRFGAASVMNVDSISAGPSVLPGVRLRDAAIQALNFQSLPMSGQAMLGLTWDTNEYFPEVVNGITHHHHVAVFSVWTEQSSS